jgi:glycosyltransferase involved in cell wall biosynthesis
MSIIVLQGQSQNNVLREFSKSITAGFIECNRSAELIDLTVDKNIPYFNELIKRSAVEGILSFNGILGDLLPENFGIPFVSWLVDAPHYHYKRLQHIGGKRHFIFPSKNHNDFLKQSKIIANSSILLAGGRVFKGQIKEQSDRKHTILLAASWMGEAKPFWNEFSDKFTKSLAIKIVQALDADQQVNVLLACHAAANKMGIKFEINDAWIRLASLAHIFIRQKDRIQIVKAIAELGLPLTLIGKGWEHNIGLGSNVNYIENLDNNDLQNFYSDSKIVINLNSSNGASERLFDSMSAGACVVTDYGDALVNLFKDKNEYCLFDRTKPASIHKSIEYILKGDIGFYMSKHALNIVNENHLWQHRAEIVSDIFDSFK